MNRSALWLGLGMALALSACGGRIIPPSPTRPSPPTSQPSVIQPVAATPVKPVQVATPSASGPNARSLGVVAGPSYSSLKISSDGASRALRAFRLSCSSVQRRVDTSGLTQGGDWAAACANATSTKDEDASRFFENGFEVVQVGDGKSFATGYYEPEIAGSRLQSSGYQIPVYRKPADLIDVDLGVFSDDLKGRKIRGRVKGTNFIPYADRTEIETGGLAGKGLEIAWAADAVEFFFLQVQGSGRLKLPDGSVMRIGYDSQNGRDYTGIGKLMKDRGLLGPNQASMQGIMAWLRANPDEGRAIMRENKSWVFFRELTGAGPLGALGIPVTAQGSVAADPAFVPLGAPVILSMDRTDATGLWIAQDTGGAIKGSNRFDTFWGAGEKARATAGGMSARGTAFVLLPIGTIAKLTTEAANGGTSPQRR